MRNRNERVLLSTCLNRKSKYFHFEDDYCRNLNVRRQLYRDFQLPAAWNDKLEHNGTLSQEKAPLSLPIMAAYEHGSRNSSHPLCFIVDGAASNYNI
jgi:hypothetical protein